MLRFGIVAAALLASLNFACAAEPNFDFDKSPCIAKTKGFERAIAVKLKPGLTGAGQLSLSEVNGGWTQNFPDVAGSAAWDYVGRAGLDGWAVYQLHQRQKAFTVLYMFGDIAAAIPDCMTLPDAPAPVSIEDMAPTAVKMYLTRLTGNASGNIATQRGRLAETTGIAASATAKNPLPGIIVTAPAAPAVPDGTSPNANMDFEKSPCRQIAKDIGPFVNVRLYPKFGDGTLKYFDVNDGSSWIKTFNTMPKELLDEVVKASAEDAWGVFQIVVDGTVIKGFTARYGFGDMQTGQCHVADQSENLLEMSDVPQIAIRAFVEGLGGDVSGTADDWRKRLVAMVARDAKARITPNLSNDTGLPEAVFQTIREFRKNCYDQGGEPSLGERYVTITDIDGDGDNDYLLSGPEASCSGQRDSGNHAGHFIIYQTTGKGPVKVFDDSVAGGQVRRQSGFASLEAAYDIGNQRVRLFYYTFRNGKVAQVKKPKGGKVVFNFSLE